MSIKNISINKTVYKISCADGGEEHLDKLTSLLDARVRELSKSLGPRVNDTMLLLLAALELEDQNCDLLNKFQESENSIEDFANIVLKKVEAMLMKVKNQN